MPDDEADLRSPSGSASPDPGVRARRGVERLSEAECMELLASVEVGRLVYDSPVWAHSAAGRVHD